MYFGLRILRIYEFMNFFLEYSSIINLAKIRLNENQIRKLVNS
jgi:hypothetical protein